MTDSTRYIGLCMAAGGVAVGSDAALGEVRRGRAKFVLVASDASERTRKQITDKCSYYHVPCFFREYDGAALAHLLGKRSACSAAAFTGRGPWKVLRDLWTPDAEKTEACQPRTPADGETQETDGTPDCYEREDD